MADISITGFLGKVSDLILNPLILLAFALAFLLFFYGIFQFVRSETTDSGREQGKRKIFYGLLGMFIMFSAYGIIHLILNTFGIPANQYPFK